MTSTDNKIVVIKEVSVENSFKAVLYENGIVEIIWNTSIEIIEVNHLNQVRQAVSELGGGRKMALYFTAHDFLQISDDAKKDASTEEGGKYTLANAVLIDNLAKKILFNFFISLYRPKIETKGFSNRSDAFEWLKKILKLNN